MIPSEITLNLNTTNLLPSTSIIIGIGLFLCFPFYSFIILGIVFMCFCHDLR